MKQIKIIKYKLEEIDKKNILHQLIDLDINSIRNLSKLMGYSNTFVWLVLDGKKYVTNEFIKKLNNLGICL